MANQRISDLTAKTTPVSADLLVIVDTEATPDETKKITLANLFSNVPAITLGGALTITGAGVIKNSAANQLNQFYGGTTAAGAGTALVLTGVDQANTGKLFVYTPNAAGNGDVERFSISGKTTTAVATWSNVTHSGIVLSTNLDTQSNPIKGGATTNILQLMGGSITDGKGAHINLGGCDHASAGSLYVYTPNAAKDAGITRLQISGNLDTAVASWANITHTGFRIGAYLGIAYGDSSSVWYSSGGDGTGGSGSGIWLSGKSHYDAGSMSIRTPNLAGNVDVSRLTITGNLATAVATWANITHAGITLSGNLDVNAQALTNCQNIQSAATNSLNVISTAVNNLMYLDSYRNAANTGIAISLRTYNGADAITTRFTLTGGVATSTAAWSNVTHTGFISSGAVWVTGTNAADQASTTIIDNSGGTGRLLCDGANATTRGSFQLMLQESDGGNAVVPIQATGSSGLLTVGRDDTGVSTSAITDMLAIQGGAGSNNESAGQGVGISVKLGNAASEVEERASLDFILASATNGAESAYAQLSFMSSGSMVACYNLGRSGIDCVQSGMYLNAPNSDNSQLLFQGRGNSTSLVNILTIQSGANGAADPHVILGADQGFLKLVGQEDLGAAADRVALASYDIAAGRRTLMVSTEETVVTESVTSDRTLAVRINGITYKLCLKS